MATVLSSAGSLCNNEARVKVDQQAAGRVVVTFPRPRPIFGDTRLTCPRVHPLVSTRDENPSRDRSARSLARSSLFGSFTSWVNPRIGRATRRRGHACRAATRRSPERTRYPRNASATGRRRHQREETRGRRERRGEGEGQGEGRAIANICGSNCPNLTSTNLKTRRERERERRGEKKEDARGCRRFFGKSDERCFPPSHLPFLLPGWLALSFAGLRVAAFFADSPTLLLSRPIEEFNPRSPRKRRPDTMVA